MRVAGFFCAPMQGKSDPSPGIDFFAGVKETRTKLQQTCCPSRECRNDGSEFAIHGQNVGSATSLFDKAVTRRFLEGRSCGKFRTDQKPHSDPQHILL